MSIITTAATDGRLRLSELLIPELTHLAVGIGSGALDPDASGLVQEIGRVRYSQRQFVTIDPAGTILVDGVPFRFSPSATPTEWLYLVFQFAAAEAQGNWSEFMLCGGGVEFITRGAAIVDGVAQAGDDRAGVNVLLLGSYTGSDNQTISLTVTTGGGPGVARVAWVASGGGSAGSGTLTNPYIDAALSGALPTGSGWQIGSTGIIPVWSGGIDGVLTLGDQWVIHATADPASATFASGGVYDPVGNVAGQVRVSGRRYDFGRINPASTKGNAVENVLMIGKVGSHG